MSGYRSRVRSSTASRSCLISFWACMSRPQPWLSKAVIGLPTLSWASRPFSGYSVQSVPDSDILSIGPPSEPWPSYLSGKPCG